MKNKVRALSEEFGLGFIYVRRHEGNILLDDNTKFPIIVMYEVAEGEMKIVGNYVATVNRYVIDVLQKTDLQDSTEVNDTYISLTRLWAAKIYKRLFEDGDLNFSGTVRWLKVGEEEYDVNVIGVRLTMEIEEVIGSRCFYDN